MHSQGYSITLKDITQKIYAEALYKNQVVKGEGDKLLRLKVQYCTGCTVLVQAGYVWAGTREGS